MTWVKLDDQFFAHPKIVNLDKDAKLLYLAGLTYCAGQLTDGLITAGGLRIIMAQVEARKQAPAGLVGAGLWEARADGCYQIHDYLQYNPSAEQVKHDRQQTAQRQERWRDRKQAVHTELEPSTNSVNNPQSNGVTNPVSNGISHSEPTALVTGAPYRSRIDPTDDSDRERDTHPHVTPAHAPGTAITKQARVPPRLPELSLPDPYPLTEEMRDWVRQKTPTIGADIDRQHSLFCAHYWADQNAKRTNWRPMWEAWMWRAVKEFAPKLPPGAAPIGPPRHYLNGGSPDAVA